MPLIGLHDGVLNTKFPIRSEDIQVEGEHLPQEGHVGKHLAPDWVAQRDQRQDIT